MRVYITFGHLDSWLSIAPTKKMVEETGIAIEWEPLLGSLGNLVNTNLKQGEEDPLAAYKARRAKARSMAAIREQARMCEMLEISADQGKRKIDPVTLSLGLNWLGQQQARTDQYFQFVELAFVNTFGQESDVESREGVEHLIGKVGVATRGFADFTVTNSKTLQENQDEILQSGVLNAPAFVIDGEIFHGREHLPLINWMLKGRSGTPPV